MRQASTAIFLSLLCLFMAACGGGGGGGTSTDAGPSAPVYTGATDRAVITTSNAGELARAAYVGGGSGTVVAGRAMSGGEGPLPRPLFVTLAEALGDVITAEEVAKHDSTARIPAYGSGYGESGCAKGQGSYTAYIDYHPATGAFTGTIEFSSLCSDGVNMTGTVSISGVIDTSTYRYKTLDMSFPSLALYSGSGSHTTGGTIGIDFTFDPAAVAIDMVLLDESTGDAYRLENVGMTILETAGYTEVEITGGRFYHPDYGYVDMATESPLRFENNGEWPTSGVMRIDGAGSTARMTVYITDTYRVEADCDGDGVYEHEEGYDTWTGATPSYLPPVADAGVDRSMYVGDTVVLDGTGTYGFYGRELAYSWAITGTPSNSYGSVTTLAGEDTASPVFSTDRAGVYVFTLTVSDGLSDPVSDKVLVTVSNLPLFADLQRLNVSVPYYDVCLDLLSAGDVNSDGRNDIVGSSSCVSSGVWNNTLQVFLSNVSGGFDNAVEYPVDYNGPYGARSLDLGDLNNDGRVDAVIGVNTSYGANSAYFIREYLQNLSGALTAMAGLDTSNSMVVKTADVNDDGLTDVVSAGQGRYVSVFLQNGSGSFSSPVTYDIYHSNDIAIGDVNNDGRNDIVVAGPRLPSGYSWIQHDLAVLLQQGDGSMGAPVYYDHATVDIKVGGVAVGDVNGDSLTDVVAVRVGLPPVSSFAVFTQSAGGTLVPGQYLVAESASKAKIADMNNDGKNDVVLDGSMVYLQNPDGTLRPYQKYFKTYSYIGDFDVADLNGDGKNDIVLIIGGSLHALFGL